MTRIGVFVWMFIAVLALLSFGTATATSPNIIGEVPGPGEFGLLVTGQSVSAEELAPFLKEEGCSAQSIFIIKNSEWILYVPWGPAFVNAKFNAEFPTGLPQYTPFYVQCAPEPFQELRYECGGATFIIKSWDIPEWMVNRIPQPSVTIEYNIPAEAVRVRVSVVIETSVGRISLETIRRLWPEFDKGYSWYTNIPGSHQIASPNEHTEGGGFIDGKWHSLTVYFWFSTESEYNRGKIHRTLPPERGYSIYSSPPFKLVEPPVILGTFWVGDDFYSIDTYNVDACRILVPPGK